jgi:hypothetical protein
VIALALLSPPAFAQTDDHGAYESDSGSYRADHPPTDESTPAEHATTEQLNAQAAEGATAPPAVLNGEAPGGLQRADAETDQNTGRYEQQLDNYHRQLDRYHAQQLDYRAAMARYDRSKWEWDNYPTDVDYYYGDRLQDVAFMADAPSRLYLAPVDGPHGWVGKVVAVKSGYGRTPEQVEIAFDRGFATWVSGTHLRFDPRTGVVMTDLTRDELWNMPGVYLQAADYR